MGSGMFQQDNTFNNIMTKIFDVVLLNVLWLIGCLPIITIGASTTALYYMTMKMVRDEEGGITKGFIRSFKENFRQSVPLTLMFLVFVGVLAADFHILGSSGENSSSMMYGICITILIIGGAVFGYVFPLLAKFENTVRNTLSNAARIALTHLWQTAVIVVLNLLPVIWLLVSPETFAKVFWIWFFAGTGASAYINSMLLVKIFDKFIPEEQELFDKTEQD